MSLLLGVQIKEEVKKGNILIEPFNEKNVSINSVDITLSNQLLTYQKFDIVNTDQGLRVYAVGNQPVLDMKKDNPVFSFEIPEEGIILDHNLLYIGSTNEKAGSDKYIPMYEGRSSMARLGIQSHLSAGFGDLGFKSNWTLEIKLVHPVKFYPNVRIGQVFFHKPDSEYLLKQKIYSGKYSKQTEPQQSRLYQDFKEA